MKTFEQDPFFYQGSEAQKAELAANQAIADGKWEDFTKDSRAQFAETVKDAVLPEHPPEYRDFRASIRS